MLNLAAIVGPTGVGKSRIAVGVGQFLDIEVISCDSMQIYRGLDVGTAKIAESEMMGIPHHMIDICDPDQPFSVSDYQKIVIPLVKEINERGKIPVLVGGTGLYYQVVVDDYQLYPIKAAPEVRRALNEEAELRGNQFLHQRLSSLDPQAAAKISPNDRKRIIRALEVIQVTGRPFSALQKRNPGRYHLAVAGISMPRALLYEHLDRRVDSMLERGLLEEVQGLLARGYGPGLNSMQALGYAQIISYLQGYLSWEETIAQIKRDTRRYAKRQLTWFRKDHRINWWELSKPTDEEVLIYEIYEYFRRTLIDDCRIG
ncbi:MAG: tRNA (adenosine(37)-N6)-dimethylallyltransferase MiaA [Syntrophomonadaceae bacterium]|jgi:tRNA dimethylallyltransferase|nr:tRNA (adenosine(37)-N6)-dimethylallyltransferase MiaA [Syntrophomonadaceae bacterium]